jgi:hypothetical protein
MQKVQIKHIGNILVFVGRGEWFGVLKRGYHLWSVRMRVSKGVASYTFSSMTGEEYLATLCLALRFASPAGSMLLAFHWAHFKGGEVWPLEMSWCTV